MRNDDFSLSTKRKLAGRVGMRCSNPECCVLTIGPNTNPESVVNIGVAAHITAASPGGPRYDSTYTSKQRQSADNGIWLCQNCAKIIDNDEDKYTVTLLTDWKTKAEKRALNELGGGNISENHEEPFKFASMSDKVLNKIIEDYKIQGEEPCLPFVGKKDSFLVQGYRLAYYPNTKREILVGENILMIKPKDI